MIAEIGHFALVLALVVALVQASVPLYGAAHNNAPLVALARPAAQLQFALVLTAFLALVHAFVVSDFSVFVVANHSGVLPFDALMLQAGVFDEHPAHRILRVLSADLVYEVPVLSDLARRSGHIRADPEQADQVLAAGHLVGVFPEGFKGIGKPFRERYRLQRFGRGGFAATAQRARVPIIPCAIVGAEEIYPMIGNSPTLARLLRLPYFPVTPLFPWLGPVGAVPLPSNWIIEFCPPVPTDATNGASADQAVASLADSVRDIIQAKLDELLAERGPVFS